MCSIGHLSIELTIHVQLATSKVSVFELITYSVLSRLVSCVLSFVLRLVCLVAHLVLSCLVMSCPVLSCPVLSNPVLSCLIPSVLSCPVLSCPVLSCPYLSGPVLSCHVLSWSCPVLSLSCHFELMCLCFFMFLQVGPVLSWPDMSYWFNLSARMVCLVCPPFKKCATNRGTQTPTQTRKQTNTHTHTHALLHSRHVPPTNVIWLMKL